MDFIILSSAERLESVATIVSIAVIALLAITLGGLFMLYYHYYSKCIKGQIEDEYIHDEIIAENKKFFKEEGEKLSETDRQFCYRYNERKLLQLHLYEKNHGKNRMKIVSNIFLVIFYLVFVSMMSFAIYVRASGELFSINNTSCLIIKSGSMEEKNEYNSYLEENNLNDQISTYSLIGIEKVEEQELKKFDIIAFRDDKERIIVHRIIRIKEDEGKIYVETRGDSNMASASYEIKIPYERIIGRFNGFQSFGLGIVIYYFQSGIGMITLAFALILLGFYDILDARLGKLIADRKLVLAIGIDYDMNIALFNHQELPYMKVDYSEPILELLPIPEDSGIHTAESGFAEIKDLGLLPLIPEIEEPDEKLMKRLSK